MNGLRDKVILVTGAASGLGYADAELLTESGATVVMTDINEDSGKAVADRLGNLFLGQNVADEHRWSEVMSEIKDRFGQLDGLVNNAGIAPIADIETTTTEVWRQTLAVHLDGTFFGCKTALGLMKESGGGSIVNMSSTAALIGIPDYLAYSAAKGGIRSMTKAIAVHCRRRKLRIRCNSVHPGSINTPMVQNAVKDLMNIELDPNDEKKRKAMGIGEPRDVADMVAYLLSDESKHVNGTEMVVDNADTIV